MCHWLKIEAFVNISCLTILLCSFFSLPFLMNFSFHLLCPFTDIFICYLLFSFVIFPCVLWKKIFVVYSQFLICFIFLPFSITCIFLFLDTGRDQCSPRQYGRRWLALPFLWHCKRFRLAGWPRCHPLHVWGSTQVSHWGKRHSNNFIKINSN